MARHWIEVVQSFVQFCHRARATLLTHDGNIVFGGENCAMLTITFLAGELSIMSRDSNG
jgi:hypothetical protein